MSSGGGEATAANPFTKTSNANILQRAIRKVMPTLIPPIQKENSPHRHNSPFKKPPPLPPSIDLPPIRLFLNQIQCKVSLPSIHQPFTQASISIDPKAIDMLQKEMKEISRMNKIFVRNVQVQNEQILGQMKGRIASVMFPEEIVSRLKMGLHFYRRESLGNDFQPILRWHPYREYIKLVSSKFQMDELMAYYAVKFSLSGAKPQKGKAISETGAADSTVPEKELFELVSHFLETDRRNLLAIYTLALHSHLPSSLNLLTLSEEYHILGSLAEAQQQEKEKCVEIISKYWGKADSVEKDGRLGKVVGKLATVFPHAELNKLQAEHYIDQPEKKEYFLGGFRPLRDYFLLGKPVEYEEALQQVQLISSSLCQKWNPHVIGAINKAKPQNEREIEFVYTVLLKLEVPLSGAVQQKWLRGCLHTVDAPVLSSMYANLERSTPMDGSLLVALLKKCMKDLHSLMPQKDGAGNLLRLFDLVIEKYVDAGNMEELEVKISFIVMALEGGEGSTLLKYLLRFLSLSPAGSSLRASIHERIRKILSKDRRIALLKDYDQCLRAVARGKEVVDHINYLQARGQQLTHYWIDIMRQWANQMGSNYNLQDVMQALLSISDKHSKNILGLLEAIKPSMLSNYPASSDSFKKLFFSLLVFYRHSAADLCQFLSNQSNFCAVILRCLPAAMGFLLISYLQESNPALPLEITLLIEKQLNSPAETATRLSAYAKEIVKDPLLPYLCTISFRQDPYLFNLLLDNGAIPAMSDSVAHLHAPSQSHAHQHAHAPSRSHALQPYTHFILAVNQEKQGKLPGEQYYELQRLIMDRLIEQIDTPAKAETAVKIAVYATNTLPLRHHLQLLPKIYKYQLICPNLGRLLVYVLCMYIAKGQFDTVQLECFTQVAHMLVLKSPTEPPYTFFVHKLIRLLQTLPSLSPSLKHILLRLREEQPNKSIAEGSALTAILEGTAIRKREVQKRINGGLEQIAGCRSTEECSGLIDDLMEFTEKAKLSSPLKYLQINTPSPVVLKSVYVKVKFINLLRLLLERCDEETQGVPQRISSLLDIFSQEAGVSNLDRVIELTAFLRLAGCVAKQRILFTHQLNRWFQMGNVMDKVRLLLLNRTDALINGRHSHYDQFQRTLDSIIFEEQMLMSRKLSLLKLLELHEKIYLVMELLHCARHLQFQITAVDPIIVLLKYAKIHLKKHINSPSQLVEFVRFKRDYFQQFSIDGLLKNCSKIEALLEELNLPMTQQEHRAYDKYVQLM